MNVTAEKLVKRTMVFAEKYSIPVTKNQFEGTVDDPVPELPYGIYMLSHETTRGADGINNLIAKDFDFELYTGQDDEKREKLAEAYENEVLMDVEYEKYVAPIPDEECFQTAYEVKGLLTKKKGEK